MKSKFLLLIVSIPILVSALFFSLKVQSLDTKNSGVIYIHADGSVEGTTDIVTGDMITYTFVADINGSIVVERSNITVDGGGHILDGSGSGNGFSLDSISSVTIRNVNVKEFGHGILLNSTSHDTLLGNNITNNGHGIHVYSSSSNSISGNSIAANNYYGIVLTSSSKNNVSENNITNNGHGVELGSSPSNSISGNNITANNHNGIWISYSSDNNTVSGNNITLNSDCGIYLSSSWSNSISRNNITANNHNGILLDSSSNYNNISGNDITDSLIGIVLSFSSNNRILYNNFINNNIQGHSGDTANIWDDGFPSGGNYWGDYCTRYPNATEIDASGIWDTPYEIYANSKDNYPFVNMIPEFPSFLIVPFLVSMTLIAIILRRRKQKKD